MSKFSRRDLLKAGAAGTVAAGLSAAGGVGPALAGSDDDGDNPQGFQIHGSVSGPGSPVPLLISITVHGPVDDLSGDGWDVPDGGDISADVIGACYYSQAGKIRRGRVLLSGAVFFANEPPSLGAEVTTVANLSTGRIKWTFAGFEFTGTGTVVRV
jgi:hypothetical protein